MKKLLGAFALLMTMVGAPVAHAAEGGVPLERAPYRVNDLAALQNGAKLFVNYCLSCHSASSMRYSDLREIGLTDEQISKNLLFTADSVNEMMTIAMTPADAKKWFGTAPPDLSVMARAKSVNAGPSGTDYIYTYMRSFYRDASKLTGWDNLVYPNVAMPHVMWQQQGPRELTKVVVHEKEGENGQPAGWERVTTTFDEFGYSTVKAEPLSGHVNHESMEFQFTPKNLAMAQAYDRQVADLAAFMSWMAEPVQIERTRIGMWVLLYLGLFLLIAWRLNAVYWKDVK
mgnify:CR=1 FL=1